MNEFLYLFKTVLSVFSAFIIPVIVVGICLYGLIKKVPVYETFIEGAKEGFQTGVSIIPYLVAIITAVSMFRASGAIDFIAHVFSPFLKVIGMPADILPLAIIRPLSGSGALGIMSEICHKYGGNAFISKLAGVMVGSTETTFYVLAVYFGSVGIKKFRHALIAGLIADIAGLTAALIICRIVF
ncbi:MAG: spore maturation protein [bacterium]